MNANEVSTACARALRTLTSTIGELVVLETSCLCSPTGNNVDVQQLVALLEDAVAGIKKAGTYAENGNESQQEKLIRLKKTVDRQIEELKATGGFTDEQIQNFLQK